MSEQGKCRFRCEGSGVSLRQKSPKRFIRRILHEEVLCKEHKAALRAIRQYECVEIRGVLASGKSGLLARVALWYAYRHADARVLAMAPTSRQAHMLHGAIMALVHANKLPGSLLRWGFKSITGGAIECASSMDTLPFQGVYGEHVLGLVDEKGSCAKEGLAILAMVATREVSTCTCSGGVHGVSLGLGAESQLAVMMEGHRHEPGQDGGS